MADSDSTRTTFQCACGAVRARLAARCMACEKHRRKPTRHCEHCAAAFLRRKDHGRDPRFCSYACRGAATRMRTAKQRTQQREADRQRICRMCRQPFTGSPRNRICSETCRKKEAAALSRTYSKARKVLRSRACKECRTVFTPDYGDKKRTYCSKRCARHWRQRLYRPIAKAMRRARMLGVACERINPMDVFERDGWRCQLCGCSTPRRLRGQMVDRAPELDHIIPLGGGHGGTHTWANVQCACRRCNGEKGASPRGQLRLSP